MKILELQPKMLELKMKMLNIKILELIMELIMKMKMLKLKLELELELKLKLELELELEKKRLADDEEDVAALARIALASTARIVSRDEACMEEGMRVYPKENPFIK